MRFELGWKGISRAEGTVLGPGHWGALSPSQHSCTVALRPAQERAGVLSVSGGLSCALPRKMKAVLVRFRGAFWGLGGLFRVWCPGRTAACSVPSPRCAGLCWDVWGQRAARCGSRSRAASSSPRVPERQEDAGMDRSVRIEVRS